jgi:hypothetical protein
MTWARSCLLLDWNSGSSSLIAIWFSLRMFLLPVGGGKVMQSLSVKILLSLLRSSLFLFVASLSLSFNISALSRYSFSVNTTPSFSSLRVQSRTTQTSEGKMCLIAFEELGLVIAEVLYTWLVISTAKLSAFSAFWSMQVLLL